MKNLTKKLIIGISICCTLPTFSQINDLDLYAMISPTVDGSHSIANEIEKENNRIVDFTKELETTDSKKRAEVTSEITICKERIVKLTKALPIAKKPVTFNFTKFDFDVADTSLELQKFRAMRNGSTDEFSISFKAPESGIARIDIVSPGGELLESYSTSKFKGRLHKNIKLNSKAGKFYFVHVSIGDQSVTKKVVFS